MILQDILLFSTKKDCADYCAEKPEVFNLVAIAR